MPESPTGAVAPEASVTSTAGSRLLIEQAEEPTQEHSHSKDDTWYLHPGTMNWCVSGTKRGVLYVMATAKSVLFRFLNVHLKKWASGILSGERSGLYS